MKYIKNKEKIRKKNKEKRKKEKKRKKKKAKDEGEEEGETIKFEIDYSTIFMKYYFAKRRRRNFIAGNKLETKEKKENIKRKSQRK